MIERCEELRFALEARDAFGVIGQCRGQQLQRNVAAERGVARAIDLAHAAGAEQRDDLYEPRTVPGTTIEDCKPNAGNQESGIRTQGWASLKESGRGLRS